MPSTHSVFNKVTAYSTLCGIPILDYKQNKLPDLDATKLKQSLTEIDVDIIDEALILFRANVLFKNFPINGDADKLLVYITVFISKCLDVGYSQEIDKAKTLMKNLIDDCEWSPTYKAHFFNTLTNVRASEVADLQQYLKGIRKEVVQRIFYILYDGEYKTLDLKWWMGFAKRKFMGYDMSTIRK